MGDTILRQGDDYSAHVIDQTVSRVIPPLVDSLKSKSQDVVSGLSDVLISFTTAFEHIPSHRRLSIFENVVSRIGPSDSLYAVVAMILDRHSTDTGVHRFIAELMARFPPNLKIKV